MLRPITTTRLLNAALAACALAGLASAETAYVLEDIGTTQQLHSFDTATPGNTAGEITITGLAANERVLGIDFRPQTGQLYALGNSNAIYTLDPTSGVATQVGSGFTDSLNGSFFGFDFNPQIDKIRIVSDQDQNYVADPDTGDANIAATTSVFYGPGDPNEGADPNVVNHAYTNAVPDASSTQLYAIDTDFNTLVTQANNAGTLGTVGELGFDIVTFGGFDISGNTGTAYLAAVVEGMTGANLFTVDLDHVP